MKRKKTMDVPVMGSTVMGERGQVVIPKNIRDRMHLRAGTKLLVVHHENGPLVMMPAEHLQKFIASVTQNLTKLNDKV